MQQNDPQPRKLGNLICYWYNSQNSPRIVIGPDWVFSVIELIIMNGLAGYFVFTTDKQLFYFQTFKKYILIQYPSLYQCIQDSVKHSHLFGIGFMTLLLQDISFIWLVLQNPGLPSRDIKIHTDSYINKVRILKQVMIIQRIIELKSVLNLRVIINYFHIDSICLIKFIDCCFCSIEIFDMLDLLIRKYRPHLFCSLCKVVYRQDTETEHCMSCGYCIEELDHQLFSLYFQNNKICYEKSQIHILYIMLPNNHHCPWSSKCIGRGNMLMFKAFLFMTVALMVYLFSGGMFSIAQS